MAALPGATIPESELPFQLAMRRGENQVPLTDLGTAERAEEISRLLETHFQFWTGFDTGMEYFVPGSWEDQEAYNWKVNLMLGRRDGEWRPDLWLYIPVEEVMGSDLERIRVFIDDEPGFALTGVSLTHVEQSPSGTVFHSTSFHAGNVMGNTNGAALVKARRIRFQLLSGQESIWVEARPDEVDQFRETATAYQLMRTLHSERAAFRPLL